MCDVAIRGRVKGVTIQILTGEPMPRRKSRSSSYFYAIVALAIVAGLLVGGVVTGAVVSQMTAEEIGGLRNEISNLRNEISGLQSGPVAFTMLG